MGASQSRRNQAIRPGALKDKSFVPNLFLLKRYEAASIARDLGQSPLASSTNLGISMWWESCPRYYHFMTEKDDDHCPRRLKANKVGQRKELSVNKDWIRGLPKLNFKMTHRNANALGEKKNASDQPSQLGTVSDSNENETEEGEKILDTANANENIIDDNGN